MTIAIDGPEGPNYDRAYWWGPLERVAELISDDAEFAGFDLDDFMVMCGYTQGGVHMIEYKHIHTRRCITLSDDALTVFRYVPPSSEAPGDNSEDADLGHYAIDRSLRDALRRLELPLGAEMRRNLTAREEVNAVGEDDGCL